MRSKTWTPAEARAFLEVAKESHYSPIWLILLTTAMRRGEALGLRWQDVDGIKHQLYVRQSVVMINGLP